VKKAKEVLAWTLENKKLDVEIKREQLEKARLDAADTRKKIYARAEQEAHQRLFKEYGVTIQSQYHDIERLRVHLREAKKSDEQAHLDLQKQKSEARNLEHELEELKNTAVVRFVFWVRKLVNPKQFKKGFTPALSTSQSPTSIGSVSVDSDIAGMSADEFKMKFIDPIEVSSQSEQK
jgi:hypothetical protein